MSDKPTRALQENICILLAFDNEHAKIIRGVVPIELLEGDYRKIAERAYPYIDKYKEAPGDHLPDLFDDFLPAKERNDDREQRIFRAFLHALKDASATVRPEYVMNRLDSFVRMQQFKSGIVEAGMRIQRGDDLALDEAESILRGALKRGISLFRPGLYLSDVGSAIEMIRQPNQSMPTGIKEFDLRSLGPSRKELHIFIALAGRGKTWWLTNLGKRAILSGYKVCHLTLELSEIKTFQRYYQALFAMAKREGRYSKAKFVLNDLNNLIGIDQSTVRPRLTLEDSDIWKKLVKRSHDWGTRLNQLIIREFPTASLSVDGLKAYLDGLESEEGFVPDLLIVDYGDLLKIDSRDYRIALGRVYQELRGIAVERDIAVATATQSNRSGLKATRVTEEHTAEDFSKIATADTVITYSQTEEEGALGLARLFVSKARSEEGRFTVLITQSYATGQFVLESAPFTSRYWKELEDASADEKDEDRS